MTVVSMQAIEVPAPSRTYTVTIGDGALNEIGRLLDHSRAPARRFVVSSPLVWRLHGPQVARALRGAEPILVPDGERFKQLATVTRIYDALVRANADRASTVITFGGGVIGDLAGFAADSYLRGIALVHVPTTLLAQVDSSIGGKVGVNLAAGKNLVGAFHAPDLVVCDPDVLATLPRREFRSGLYEVVKYGVIASGDVFSRVSANLAAIFARDTRVLTPLIADCCRIKADVVMADEREGGLRRILNFGHTVGHALESITSYRRFRHGEAIGYGMLAAARLSASRGLMSNDDEARLAEVIRQMGPLPTVNDLRASHALDVIAHDKKVVKGTLHFVLARGIGATEIVKDVREKELTTAMRAIGMRA
jgi:3-dehydroquinate synthase